MKRRGFGWGDRIDDPAGSLGVLLMGIRAYDLVSDRAYLLAGEDALSERV